MIDTAEYITEYALRAAADLANQINHARDAMAAPQTLADRLAIKRDIKRMQDARRVLLGVQS